MRPAIATILIILITAVPSAALAANPVQSPTAAACAATHLGAPQLGGSQSNSQVVVEILQGSQARTYLERVKKAHPERFKGVGDELRKIGAHPTNIVTVARTKRLQFPSSKQESNPASEEQANIPGLSPSNNAQTRSDSASNADGEIILSAWDDGYDGTWEGTIYHEDYSDGSWSTWEGQGNIETADYYGIWGNIVSAGGPGGDPLPKSATGTEAVSQKDLSSITALYGWKDWFWCLVAGASACHGTCIWLGPAWGGCMLACGAAIAILCALQEF